MYTSLYPCMTSLKESVLSDDRFSKKNNRFHVYLLTCLWLSPHVFPIADIKVSMIKTAWKIGNEFLSYPDLFPHPEKSVICQSLIPYLYAKGLPRKNACLVWDLIQVSIAHNLRISAHEPGNVKLKFPLSSFVELWRKEGTSCVIFPRDNTSSKLIWLDFLSRSLKRAVYVINKKYLQTFPN